MKKNLVVGIVLSLSVLFSGCSSNVDSEKTYDKEFLKDLSKGLSERWSMEAKSNESQDEYYKRLVSAELDRVLEYANKKFEDTQLQEKAISYINLLKTQQEALTYYSADTIKYDEMWQGAYDDRSQLIKIFIDDYGLEFSSKYDGTVTEMLNNAKVATENDEFQKAVDQMVKNIVFNKSKKEHSYSYYEAIVENTTSKTFENFSLDINLLDSDGIIVKTTYASVANWATGQKAKLNFMTDIDFSSYELTADYYIE